MQSWQKIDVVKNARVEQFIRLRDKNRQPYGAMAVIIAEVPISGESRTEKLLFIGESKETFKDLREEGFIWEKAKLIAEGRARRALAEHVGAKGFPRAPQKGDPNFGVVEQKPVNHYVVSLDTLTHASPIGERVKKHVPRFILKKIGFVYEGK